jgi:hypothetical protein
MEEHPAIIIKPVFTDKVNAVQGKLQPFGPLFHPVVEGSQHPGEPACLPHPLVRIQQGAVSVDAKHEPAPFPVDAVPDPEGDGIIQQTVTVNADVFINCIQFHGEEI